MSAPLESKLVSYKDQPFLKEAIFEAEHRQERFSPQSLTSHSKDVRTNI